MNNIRIRVWAQQQLRAHNDVGHLGGYRAWLGDGAPRSSMNLRRFTLHSLRDQYANIALHV